MKGFVGILLGAFCAVVIACASSPSKTAAPMMPPTVTSGQHAVAPMPGSPEDDQIAKLAQEIETQRVQLGLPEQQPTPFTCAGASCAQGAQEMATSAEPNPTLTCKPTTGTCTQSCTISDSICGNSKKICDIAAKLDGDQWAATKCSDNTQTCDSARKRCCDCSK